MNQGLELFLLGIAMTAIFCSFIYPVTLSYLKEAFEDSEDAIGAFQSVKSFGLLAPVTLNLLVSPLTSMFIPGFLLVVSCALIFFLPKPKI